LSATYYILAPVRDITVLCMLADIIYASIRPDMYPTYQFVSSLSKLWTQYIENELTNFVVNVSVPWGNGMKRSILRVRRSKFSRSYDAEIGHN